MGCRGEEVEHGNLGDLQNHFKRKGGRLLEKRGGWGVECDSLSHARSPTP